MFSKCRYESLPLYSLVLWPRIFKTVLHASTIYSSCLMSILFPLSFGLMLLLKIATQYEIGKYLVHVYSAIFFKHKISSEIPDLSNFKCFFKHSYIPTKTLNMTITRWINRHCSIFELVH